MSKVVEAFENFRYRAFSIGVCGAFAFDSAIDAIRHVLNNNTDGFVFNGIFFAVFAWWTYESAVSMRESREKFEVTEKSDSDSDSQ